MMKQRGDEKPKTDPTKKRKINWNLVVIASLVVLDIIFLCNYHQWDYQSSQNITEWVRNLLSSLVVPLFNDFLFPPLFMFSPTQKRL